jgi:CBS domain-containing protein
LNFPRIALMLAAAVGAAALRLETRARKGFEEARMNVAAILQDKGDTVHTIEPGARLEDAAKALDRLAIGALVVVDARRRVLGVLSERDIAREIARRGAAALGAAASTAMTEEVVTATPADTLHELMSRMTKRRIRHLPVISGGKLVGLVSIGDVVKWRIREAELEAQAMRDYITAG